MRGAHWLVLPALLTASALAQTSAQEDHGNALRACAAIEAPAERLACYDRLSGRGTPAGSTRPAASAAPTAPTTATAPTAATAPTIATAPTAATAPAIATVPRSAAAPTPAARAASTAAAPSPKAATSAADTFGLYAAEHPAPPPAAALLTGRVQAVGTSSDGRQTVTLEDGALWKLETFDPLLAAGDVVTIRRGALHSFILQTPTRREHRAQRLR